MMNKIFFSYKFFEGTSYSVVLLDKNKQIIKVNPSFCLASGYKEKEVLQKHISIFQSGRHEPSFYEQLWDKVDEVGFWEGESWFRRKDGELYLTKRNIFVNPVEDDDENPYHYIVLGRDMREEVLALNEEEAFHSKDFITGLPHSFIFREILSSMIKDATKKKSKLAVVLLDLVRFKQINESFGYTIGDHFLNIIAERLRACVGEEMLMTRMGGDVFALVINGIKNEKDIVKVVDRILHNFKTEPFSFSGQEIYLSTTIGISVFPTDGATEHELFRAADLARYRAKENGAGNYQFYLPSLNARMFERLVLENNLRKAVENEHLVLFYQPQIDIKTGEVTGLEALIRWQHPEFGTVPPSQFIPTAEETGLILPIGKWVIKEACRQLEAWEKEGYKPIVISVNISAKQLQPQLVNDVKTYLKQFNVQPKYLELEITETAVMKNVEDAILILRELEKIGIKISIDDFGTGYSSLNYLAKLPLHALKIDRSFIQNVSFSKEAITIVSTVIAMAHKLNLAVVAEGVEKESDLLFLSEMNCEKYQGFYFSPPVPSYEVIQFLKK